MKRIKSIIGFCILSLNYIYPLQGFAEELKQTGNDASGWSDQSITKLRLLDKLESKTVILTIPINKVQQYKSLTIKSIRCSTKLASTVKDNAAFIQVIDQDPARKINFSSWIFSATPNISVFEHPLYNITLVGCSGSSIKPMIYNNIDSIESKSNSIDKSSQTELIEKSLQQSIDSQR